MELLSPAGSSESVIAAVQNGADAVYMGLNNFNARKNARNFSDIEFEKAVKYCHIRGCKVYVTLNTLVSDLEMREAVNMALKAYSYGADAILIQDLGLAKNISSVEPNIELHASTQMSINNLDGVLMAADMGFSRVVLARELSLDQIQYITKNSPIETEVFVHGALCFSYSGQCYMSAVIGRRSGNRGMCAQPCRMKYSMDNKRNEYPLSLKDNCLVKHLRELNDAGVSCIKIEGRMRRPEYVAIVTNIYSKALKSGKEVTEDDINLLKSAFSRDGFTDGYFSGKKEDMNGVKGFESAPEHLFAQVRKDYLNGEKKRVPLKLYARAMRGTPIQAVCVDSEGHKVAVEGTYPENSISHETTEEEFIAQLKKTGGTPYYFDKLEAKIAPGLYISPSSINSIRRNVLSSITKYRSSWNPNNNKINKDIVELPKLNEDLNIHTKPKIIFQFSFEKQITKELAGLRPDYIYIPLDLLLECSKKLIPFLEMGSIPVVVLPRIIKDNDRINIEEKLKSVAKLGIKEVLCGNLGTISLAQKAGFFVRGDFGLNVYNSWSKDYLNKLGLISATLSFELRLSQICSMASCIDSEIIAYGRLPLMLTEQCILKDISNRCTCPEPSYLHDRFGASFPVIRTGSCQNEILNSKKLFLADKNNDLNKCNLWAIRLVFTTESSKECLDVASSYYGYSDYKPNELTRGLYYRGVT